MKCFKYITTSVVTALMLAGCGGGGSDSTSTTPDTTTNNMTTNDTTTKDTALIGKFVDAPVAGLSYSTPSYSGETDANGQFKYKVGEQVTFKLGDLTIGSVDGTSIVTPKKFGNATKAANISYILQNLDTDGDAANDIIILPKKDILNTYFSQSGVTSIDLENNTSVIELVNGLKSQIETTHNIQLPNVDTTEATSNMDQYTTENSKIYTYNDLVGKNYIEIECSNIIGCQKLGTVTFGKDTVSYRHYAGESGVGDVTSKNDDGTFATYWPNENETYYEKIVDLSPYELKLCEAESQEKAKHCTQVNDGRYFVTVDQADSFIANKEASLKNIAPKTLVRDFSEIQNKKLWNLSTYNQPLHDYYKIIQSDGTIIPQYSGESLHASFQNGSIHITGTNENEALDRTYTVYKYDLSGKTYDAFDFGSWEIMDATIPHAQVTFPQDSVMYCHIMYDECFVNDTAIEALVNPLNATDSTQTSQPVTDNKKFTSDFYVPGSEYYVVIERESGIQHWKFGQNGMVMDRLGQESQSEFDNPPDHFSVSSDGRTLTWTVTDDEEAAAKGMVPYDVNFTILEKSNDHIQLQAQSEPYGIDKLDLFKDLDTVKQYAASTQYGFGKEWLKNRTLYYVLTDTEDDNNNGIKGEKIVIAWMFGDGGRYTIDFNIDDNTTPANCNVDATNCGPYSIDSNGVLEIIDGDGDWETYKIIDTDGKKITTESYAKWKNAPEEEYFFTTKSAAQQYLNSL